MSEREHDEPTTPPEAGPAPPEAGPAQADDGPAAPRHRRSPYDVGGTREAGHDAGPGPDGAPAGPRPMLERIGMAGIALVLGVMFALVGVASFMGGEPFLGVMGLAGTLMVLWVGGLTLFKGR